MAKSKITAVLVPKNKKIIRRVLKKAGISYHMEGAIFRHKPVNGRGTAIAILGRGRMVFGTPGYGLDDNSYKFINYMDYLKYDGNPQIRKIII